MKDKQSHRIKYQPMPERIYYGPPIESYYMPVYKNIPWILDLCYKGVQPFQNIVSDLAYQIKDCHTEKTQDYSYTGWCFDTLWSVWFKSMHERQIPVYMRFMAGDSSDVVWIADHEIGKLSESAMLLTVNTGKISGADLNASLAAAFEDAMTQYNQLLHIENVQCRKDWSNSELCNFAELPDNLFNYVCDICDLFSPDGMHARVLETAQAIRNMNCFEFLNCCNQHRCYRYAEILYEFDKITRLDEMCGKMWLFASTQRDCWWLAGPLCNVMMQEGSFSSQVKSGKYGRLKNIDIDVVSGNEMRKIAESRKAGKKVEAPENMYRIIETLQFFMYEQMEEYMRNLNDVVCDIHDQLEPT